MKWFRAVSESGTEYSHTEEDSNLVKVVSSGMSALSSETINVVYMTVVPAEKIAEWATGEGKIDFEWLRENSGASVPQVRSHLFVSGFSGWRISTPIVKVEEK